MSVSRLVTVGRWHSRLLAVWSLLALAAPSHAVTLVWNNAAGGTASTAGNWTPAQVPAAADILRFDIPNTYTVTFNATADTAAVQQFFGGDVTLNSTSPLRLRTGFHVASTAGLVATARLTSGTVRMGWAASVGTGNGATGTLRVAGGTSDLLQNTAGAAGPVAMNVSGTGVSNGGTGEIVVSNGGNLRLAHLLNLGRDPGGLGTLRVRGLGSTGSGNRRSLASADSTTSDARVGMDGGHGVVEVQDGGLFRVGRDVIMAERPGDVADMTIKGSNAIDSSRVRIKDDLWLAANDTSSFASGTATLVVDSLGVLVVDDSTVVGDPQGSTALLRLMATSRMVTRHLILRQSTGGSVDLQGGTLQIDGGTLQTNSGRLPFAGGPGFPRIQLMNGATAAFTGDAANPPLIVGTTDDAFLTVNGGSQVTANGGRVTLAQSAGSGGTLEVVGGGQFTSDSPANVAVDGNAVLRVASGGQATFNGLDVGAGSSGNGYVNVFDSASLLTCTGPLNVGGSTLSAIGNGSFSVANGGRVNLAAPVIAGTIWPGNDIYVDDLSRIDMTGLLTVRGELTMSGGLVSGGSVVLRGTGAITGTGVVDCGISAGVDSTVAILASGDMEIGRDVAGGSVLIRGLLDVGTRIVTVHDPDSAVVGVVELSGGELRLPVGGGVIEAGKRLVGHGVIRGPLTPRGLLISAGTAGLRFAGPVAGIGQGAGGDKFVFLGGSYFQGGGVIDAVVQSDSGSFMRATSALTLGRNATANAVVIDGRLLTGPQQVLLRSGDDIVVGGSLELEGGTVNMSGGSSEIRIDPGALVVGKGLVNARLSIDGLVSPEGLSLEPQSAGGFAPAGSAGEIRVNGDLALGSTATYVAELGAHAAAEWDTLTTTGSAAVSGTLALRLLPNYAAAVGDSFRVVRCATRTGTFSAVTLNDAPLVGGLEVHYASNGVWVVVTGVVGVGGDPGETAAVSTLSLAPFGSPGRNPSIELALPRSASVDVSAYDTSGRRVALLHQGELAAGRHRFAFSERLTGAGMYFVRAAITEGSSTTIRTTRVVRLR